MHQYQFVSIKGAPEGTRYAPQLMFRNRYSVSLADPLSIPDLYRYATTIATAERCLMPADAHHKQVLCLEVTEGEPYGALSNCFVMSRPLLDDGTAFASIQGMRADPWYDPFTGLSVARSRKNGKVTLNWYPYAFTKTDQREFTRQDIGSRDTILRTDSDLATFWFPLYCDILSSLEGLDTSVMIDHIGNATAVSELVGPPVLAHPTQLERARRQDFRYGRDPRMWEGYIQFGMDKLAAAQQTLHELNLFYDYMWGDGVIPFMGPWFDDVTAAFKVWAGLAFTCGMTVPDAHGHSLRDINLAANDAGATPAVTITPGPVADLVFTLLARLWAVEATFNTFNVSFTPDVNRIGFAPAYSQDRIDAMYEVWNEAQDLVQEAMRCLGIIQAVVTFKQKKRKHGDPPAVKIGRIDTTASVQSFIEPITDNYAITFVPLPYFDRGPKLGPLLHNEVSVTPNTPTVRQAKIFNGGDRGRAIVTPFNGPAFWGWVSDIVGIIFEDNPIVSAITTTISGILDAPGAAKPTPGAPVLD